MEQIGIYVYIRPMAMRSESSLSIHALQHIAEICLEHLESQNDGKFTKYTVF